MNRPSPNEYPAYYQKYIDSAPDMPFAQVIAANTEEALQLLRQIPEEKYNYAYAPDKWTVKDVVMHIIDTERGMSFRAFVAARGDSQMPLYTMEENLYARNVQLTNRNMGSILDEFLAVRRASELLLSHLSAEQATWRCNVAGNAFTVRALAFIIVGHTNHHLDVLTKRYL